MLTNPTAPVDQKQRPLRRARAEAFLAYLREEVSVALGDHLYEVFKFEGWSRGDVDRAIDDLVDNGSITIDVHRQFITLCISSDEGTA